jgi:hypothetical protein
MGPTRGRIGLKTGYKLLGYVVWRGGLWLVRRNFPNLGRNLALAAAAGALLAGAGVAVASQRGSSPE